MSSQKGFEGNATIIIVIIAVAVLGAAIISLVGFQKEPVTTNDQAELKKFASPQELENFLNSSQRYGGYYGPMMAERTQATQAGVPSADKAQDYSTTNVQVEGVDEADIVKNDAKYIYTISGSNIVILDAFPAEDSKIISAINLSGNSVQEMYVNDDRLVVFGNVIEQYPYPRPLPTEERIAAPVIEGESLIAPIPYIQPSSFIKIYDVSDRSNPVLKKDLVFNGTYFNSRMIGNYVYVVVNSQPYYIGGGIMFPTFSSEQKGFPDIYYFDVPSSSYSFTNIISINVKDDNSEIQNKVYLLDYASAMYVSQDNIYLVYQKQIKPSYRTERIVDEIIIPSAPADVAERIRSVMASDKFYYEKEQAISEIMQEWMQSLSPEQAGELQKKFEEKYYEIESDIQKEYQKSIVHRISISNGNIEYKAHGEIPGMPLNQFSMDQSGDYFRIATTTNNFRSFGIGIAVPAVRGGTEPAVAGGSSGSVSSGSAEAGVAVVGTSKTENPTEPTEPIEPTETTIETTSTVTVEEASSLNHIYVLDMDMNVVGKLENLAPDERIYSARFLGNRVYLVTFRQIDPLFVIDLSDPASPKVLGQLKIPGVSDYLHYYDDNHIIGVGRDATEKGQVTGLKLALFDVSDVANPKEVAKYIIGERGTYSEALNDHKAFLFSKEKNLLVIPVNLAEKDYQQTWQGAFVFNLDLENGFVLKGKVTHEERQQDPYYYASGIRRSLYMDDVLYTISDKKVKSNDLSDMDEIKEIDLPYTEPWGYYWITKGSVIGETVAEPV